MIERQIIIGLITSTEYYQRIQNIWNPQLLESTTAKRIAEWCWEYYIKFSKAPGKDIESIFFQKVKIGNISKEIAEEIEHDILPGLSDEYTQEPPNLDYLVKETKQHLSERHLAVHKDTIEALLSKGQLEEAEKLAGDYKSLDISPTNLSNYILSITQIREKKVPRPPLLMKPWLREGQTTILYGNFGSGKSLLALLVAYILGLKENDGPTYEIGTWQVKKSTGCLYIDGEIGEQEMEDRVAQFEWLGKQQGKNRLRVLSIPEYQIVTEDSFYLSNRINQLKIIQWLKDHPNYKLIILDSASTLFGLLEENDNSEWNNKINPFLRDLRALGVACLLLHHSGKDNKKGLRGASAIGAMAHNIFRLKDHENKNIDDGEAWFILDKDKQRSRGFSFKAFSLRFSCENNGMESHWEITENY